MTLSLKKSAIAVATAATALTGVVAAPMASAAPAPYADYALVPKTGHVTLTHEQALIMEKSGLHEASAIFAKEFNKSPIPLESTQFLVLVSYLATDDDFHEVAATPGTKLSYSWTVKDGGHRITTRSVVVKG